MGSENGCCDMCDMPLAWIGNGATLVRVRRFVYHVRCWLEYLAPSGHARWRAN